ncbi:hypothetical protein HHUSO_G29578 [Huso huso]|uniref:Uncharacterized protein n=1 Tax=Huso huso TaxID=61971 RepID=A0ABR0YF57_HUSHU
MNCQAIQSRVLCSLYTAPSQVSNRNDCYLTCHYDNISCTSGSPVAKGMSLVSICVYSYTGGKVFKRSG